MNLRGLLTVLVAAACILAVGVASTSLDAVETDPSDVIDTSKIPTQDNQPSGGGGGTSSGSGSATSQDYESGNEEDASINQVQGSVEDTMDLSKGDVESTVKGGGELVRSFWQRYMWHIIGTIVGIAVLVIGYILYRRRSTRTSNKPVIVYDADTSNDVYKSWWEMVEMLDADELETKTPQEFAEMAVDEGFDPEAVSELTKLFEETLYGGKEVTREEERRAREAVERIKAEREGRNRAV